MPSMAKHNLSLPVARITFRCAPCSHTFKVAPAQVIDAPELEHHPFRYFSPCPYCKNDVEQASFEKSLFKAWKNATGPKTAEGKAATAANLQGHPTSEESLRTRFNAMRHGLAAKTATYFPAKPDGYAFCSGCKVDRDYCATQPACEKQTMLFMKTHAAFEQKDPRHLTGIFSGMQAATLAMVQQMLQTILADGVAIRNPEWFTDKEGNLKLAQFADPQTGETTQIINIEAHPLLKPLAEFLSRNNMSMADLGMTPKIVDEKAQDMGQLKNAGDQREAVTDFMTQQANSLAALVEKMGKAKANAARDPVLIEYRRENGGGQ
jgi:hypothetical protein